MLMMSILLNMAIVIAEAVVLMQLMKGEGKGILIYYTTDSNLLALFSSALYCICAFFALQRGNQQVWAPVGMLRYMATSCLTITFLVVVFVLSRYEELGGMKHLLLDGDMKYTHLVCPVLSMLSFLCFEDTSAFPQYSVAICMIPTLLYAAVSVLMNLIRRWTGPYPFLKVYENGWKKSVLAALILLPCFLLISAGLLYLNRLLQPLFL